MGRRLLPARLLPWSRPRPLERLVLLPLLVIAIYALRHGCLLVLRRRRRPGRWLVRSPLPVVIALYALLLLRPRRRIVDLLVMFKIPVVVRLALHRSSLRVLRPRRRHVARRSARHPPALLLPGPRLRTLELLVALFMLLVIAPALLLPGPRPRRRIVDLLVTFKFLVIALSALRRSSLLALRPRRRRVARRWARQLPALLLPKPAALFAQSHGYRLEVRSALPELLPLRPRLRTLELLVSFMLIIMMAFHTVFLPVLPPRCGLGSRRAMPPPLALLLPRLWPRNMVLAVLFMTIVLTL